MKIKKNVLIKLRESLPAGSAESIKERLNEKGNIFSTSYIYRVLDPDSDDYNTIIIDEAINYLEELSILNHQKERRILDSVNQ